MAKRLSTGIIAPTQELEPSLTSVLLKRHRSAIIWTAIVALLAFSALSIATGMALIAYMILPNTLLLYGLTEPEEAHRYEVNRQSIADALFLPAYAPAALMAFVWFAFEYSGYPILANIIPLVIPILFIPYFARQVRNHRKKTWNTMVRRLELAVIEHVPFASMDLRSTTMPPTGMTRYDEAEWETQRRRQQAFDTWLKVNVPLMRKVDLMAGGIEPARALDPDVVPLTAEELLTFKAMEDLAAEPIPAESH